MSEYVGEPIDRVDGLLKVTGKATYAAEVAVAGVVHAVIVGSTIARGWIVSMETGAAEKAPGVITVLTHLNAPKIPGLESPASSLGGVKTTPQARVLQVLQSNDVRYDGQPVAVVVADTLEHAQYAASLVDVRYVAFRPNVVIESADSAPFDPKPSPGRPPWDSRRGDPDHAFASAPVRVEETYSTPIENHNPIEMQATLAVWYGDGHVTLYDTTQGVVAVRQRIAEAFGLPIESVRVVSRFLGGGFGTKGTPWSHVVLAVMASRATRRPVKLVVTRQQMFAFVGYRARTVQRLALDAKKDGTLVSVRHDVLSETSRFDEFMEPAALATRMLYACPNVRTSHRLVRLDLSTPTFMRAPGYASGSFGIECAMDELACALDMDPIALRMKNYAETDQEEGKPFSSKSLRECYRQAADRFGWARRSPEPRSMRDGRWLVGWGMASATYPAHQSPASALARLRPDGTVLVLSATQDLGTGTYTVMTQIAADALGLPMDAVKFELGDTTYPSAPTSAGSQTAASVGPAVRAAALALVSKLAKLASSDRRSPLFGAAEGDLDVEAGALVVRGDRTKREAFIEILRRNGGQPIEAAVTEQVAEDRKRFSLYSFGAQLVEVRVDEELGIARVSRVVSAFGAGRILNAKTGMSQLVGGIVWGIGLALEERTVHDDRDGRLVTKDLSEYHVPVNADVPPIDVITVPEEDPYVNAIGAKGIGEIGIVGMGAAIANAIHHATGRRMRDLPITVERLMRGGEAA